MKTVIVISASILLSSAILSAQSHHSLLGQTPAVSFENILVESLAGDSLSSSFLIWVKKSVAPHFHEHHSENVIILDGHAQMRIGNDTLQIEKGDHLFIPKGTPHAVWVKSDKPLKAISIQSPRFDGKDRVLIE